jgi:hypothetical protein
MVIAFMNGDMIRVVQHNLWQKAGAKNTRAASTVLKLQTRPYVKPDVGGIANETI